MDGDGPPAESTGASPITLSTGQTVHLPLTTAATMVGAAVTAPRERLTPLLPDGLRPATVAPGEKGAVCFLSVEYHQIGVAGIEPYDEFGVVVPAAPASSSPIAGLSALTDPGGYVWYLPVTTEPARALGVDVWGYPKVVADITHEDAGSTRRTTVTVDGERFVELSVDRPSTLPVTATLDSYAVKDGTTLRIPAAIDAEVGAWPLSSAASVSLGEHECADRLREAGLDLGGRVLGRVSLEGTVRFQPGEPVADC